MDLESKYIDMNYENYEKKMPFNKDQYTAIKEKYTTLNIFIMSLIGISGIFPLLYLISGMVKFKNQDWIRFLKLIVLAIVAGILYYIATHANSFNVLV